METKDIRLANILQIASQYKRDAEFCKVIEMNPTYFSQLRNERKVIGDDLARRIEEKLSLPRGYLDTPKGNPASTGTEIPIDTLSIAYALQTLSPAVRASLSQLIYHLAAEAKSVATATASVKAEALAEPQ